MRGFVIRRLVSIAAIMLAACASPSSVQTERLNYEVYTSGPRGYFVTSAIIYGPSEAVLVDAQFLQSDAMRVADRVDLLGRRLTTIIITHPDADHYMGLAALHSRFPHARILMRPDAIPAFEENLPRYLSMMRRTMADEAPQSVPTPAPLEESTLRVDGEQIEIITGLQGDFHARPANSAVWIPSQRALFVSDLAFDGVHLWLENSTAESRARWRADLARLEELAADVVIAGHRANADAPFSPSVLAATRAYLDEFDRQLAANSTPESFTAAMTSHYPAHALPLFLTLAGRSQYSGAGQAG